MNLELKSTLIGLSAGLIICLLIFIIMSFKQISLKKKYAKINKKLKNMLIDKMDVESEGLSGIKAELEKLRKENENLRISLNIAMQNPSNKSTIRLEVLQNAIDKIMLSSPGFGTAWTAALQEAEDEISAIYAGKKPFFKRLFMGQTRQKSISDTSETSEN